MTTTDEKLKITCPACDNEDVFVNEFKVCQCRDCLHVFTVEGRLKVEKGYCDTCGEKLAGHPKCKECGGLIGPGHVSGEKLIKGKCALCAHEPRSNGNMIIHDTRSVRHTPNRLAISRCITQYEGSGFSYHSG